MTVTSARFALDSHLPGNSPPTPTVRDEPHVIIELPELPLGSSPWVYAIEGYTQERLLSGAPWKPLSREADFEKELQLELPYQLIESIGLHVMTRRLAGTTYALDPDYVSDLEWHLAMKVNRLIQHRPEWRSLIVEEYLRRQQAYTPEQLRQMIYERANPKAKPVVTICKPDRCQIMENLLTVAEREGQVTFFSRRVLLAWRHTTAFKLRMRAKQRLILRDGPSWTSGAPAPMPTHSVAPDEMPRLAPMSLAAEEEMSQIVAAVQGNRGNFNENHERENENLFDRVQAEARRLARQKGSSIVHFRDIRQSAEAMDASFQKKTSRSPSEELPQHIDEVVVALAALQAETLRLSRGGIAPPRVLIVGETGTEESPPIVAKMFQEAGAEVATCDLKESTFKGIPHYEGDAANIQDQGWDMVICHPPCTYLSNAGVTWLANDPIRWQQMRQNASVFRQLYAAQAPFVVAENAKMHRYARMLIGDVRPTQYVHPWQHGHGHTKPTGLYLRNLPPLVPSKEVQGRENALASLTPGPTRAEKRSRTYPGIAAAMVIQWMPLLHRHTEAPATPRNGLTAKQMVEKSSVIPTTRIQIAFVRRAGGLQVMTLKGSTELPMESVPDNGQLGPALRNMADGLQVVDGWKEALLTSYNTYPDGERCFYETPSGRFENRRPTMTRVWIIDITDTHENHQVATALPRNTRLQDARWIPLENLTAPFQYEPKLSALAHRYRRELEAAARAPLDPLQPRVLATVYDVDERKLPNFRQPWLVDYEDLPPPPPTPRHIRRLRGKWRIWTAITQIGTEGPDEDAPYSNDGIPVYQWEALPPEITDLLNAYLGLPFKPMKGVQEEKTPSTEARKPRKRREERLRDTQTCVATHQPKMDLSGLREVNWRARPAEWLEAKGSNASPPLTQKSKLLWDVKVRRASDLLGIGASRAPLPAAREPYPNNNRGAKIAFMRNEYGRFIASQTAITAEVAVVNPTTPEGHNGTRDAETKYLQWLIDHTCDKPNNTVAAMLRSASADSLMGQDVTLTPHLGAYASSALYVNNFCVVRKAQTRHTSDDMYTVNNVVMPASKVLADTGAAPSIVTTELLEKLPKDCRISRDPNAAVGRLNGADGKPLITLGTVRIDFKLGNTSCQHEFIVVRGKPLVLLGNDFLVPRSAKIHLNTDGEGNGHITLTSTTHEGTSKTHSFGVSGNSRQTNGLHAITRSLNQEVALVTQGDNSLFTTEHKWAVPLTTTTEAIPTDSAVEKLMPEPTKPACQITDAFSKDDWKLETSEHLLYTTHAVVIPERSRVTIKVRAPQALIEQKGVPSCLVDRMPSYPGMNRVPAVVTQLVTVEEGHVKVQIVNSSNKKLSIAGNSPLAMLDSEYYVRGRYSQKAQLASLQEGRDPIAILSEIETKLLGDVSIDPDGRLSDEQKLSVRRLVAENISAFATDPKNPTKTHLMEVELPLKAEATPHRHAASRLGEEGRQLIEKHVEEMESRGIIRKSNSAWGSRVVLVTKKDGSIRFCVDYRDLNSKLKLQDSPIPLTIEALDRLSSGEGCPTSLFLSTLDLASGFWTLPIKETDKALTAFVTHRQKYEFNYLPFGVQSGPSYMCRLMDAALQGLAWETCMPYLDDVGIWSTGTGKDLVEREAASFDQMMIRLKAVFERLRWAGLSMKASKCILFATKAEYLGHIVSREGLRMDPKKIAVVKEMDPTTINTVTRVRSFLGMCSYYRRFIEGFSRIATPLTDLTKDGVDVEQESQTPACQRAMQILIKAITSEPVMSAPRFDRPFIVKTDAANKEGLGGVLSQHDDEGREKVVAYHGRRLNKHERNYTVTEIELLAAVDSIKHWRPYLWGRSFKLVIDHSALRWLHTMRDTMEGGPASRLMRWILKLSEYRFHVEHKPGALHKDADAISRLVATANPVEFPGTVAPTTASNPTPRNKRVMTARSKQVAGRTHSTPQEVNLSYLQTGAPSIDMLREEQKDDPECIEIVNYLSGTLDDITDASDLQRLAKLVRTTSSGTHNQKRAVATPQGDPTEPLKIIKRIFERDGMLYRVTRLGETSQPEDDHWVPYVPSKLRQPLITAFHDRMGHASRDRVRIALQKRYYWPHMRQEIHDYVSECHECTMAKPPSTRGRNPVGPSVGRYPFDLLYTDILDMADTYDYSKAKATGHRKLVVFADSLSRWIEAIPVHKDPTSAEIMNIFNEHIVARYGVPRAIVSDRGSNLVGKLNGEILRCTGTDMRGTTAEHKEANGVVERFNQTLSNMVRASNEGGGNWRDHLPFVLMAYRATPHRVTKESPAMILYGRELRLPAQLGTSETPPSTLLNTKPTKEVREYATRLHNRLVYAWKAAYDSTRESQGETVADTTAKSIRGHKDYQVNDRVVRRLYDRANALANKYAGPYRITEIMGKGRYKVQDLENKHVFNEFDVSNLRPYKTYTDDEELKPDEYIVERLLSRRTVNGTDSYLVKYQGYPMSVAQWTSKSELERRCKDEVTKYDLDHPKGTKAATRPTAPRADTPVPGTLGMPTSEGNQAPTEPTDDPTSHLPEIARFSMGRWAYGRKVQTRHAKGTKVVWKDANNFTPAELESDPFVSMRGEASEIAEADSDLASVFRQVAEYPYTTQTPEQPDDEPMTIKEEVVIPRTSKVWFVTNEEAMCYHRADDVTERQQLDTYGGEMESIDEGSHAKCALRRLETQVKLPIAWLTHVKRAMTLDPEGQETMRIDLYDREVRSRVAVWFIRLTEEEAEEIPALTLSGETEIALQTMRWRPHGEILSNLSTFDRTISPLVKAMKKWLLPLSSR